MDPRRTFEPFVGFGCVSGFVPDGKRWYFAVHRSTVDAMRGKPASDKSIRIGIRTEQG